MKQEEIDMDALKELLGDEEAGKVTRVFAHNRFKADDGMVFVEEEITDRDGVSDTWRTEKPMAELKPDDKVARCVVCGEYAKYIDHCWPFETHGNRCEEHRNSRINEDVFNETGKGIEVCEVHYEVLSLMRKMRHVLNLLESRNAHTGMAGMFPSPVEKTIIFALDALERLEPKEWPDEVAKEDEKDGE